MRALLSVYDKTGVVDLARGLAAAGWDLVSSGGTASAIADAGIAVTDVADLTGAPAILGHRVMTLHPKVHGGLLADRDDPAHRADMEAHGIEGIDLLVSNLYPFGSDPADFTHGGPGGSAGPVDLIDIGGPAMIRAGAKNHAHVAVVVDPADYAPVLDEVTTSGAISAATRQRLAAKAFAATAAYDAAVAAWFAGEVAATDAAAGADAPDPLPAALRIDASREPVTLRYGENPHQRAALYRTVGADPWWAHVTQHSGMALSYLNLYDADAAWLLAHDLAQATGQVACAIIKHANPCGAAVAPTLAEAYQAGVRLRPALGLRRHRGHLVPHRSGHRGADGRGGPGRRRHRPGVRRRRRRRPPGQAQEHPTPRGPRADARPAPRPSRHRWLPGAGAPRVRRPARELAGRHRAATQPSRSWPTPRSPSGCAGGSRRTPSCW